MKLLIVKENKEYTLLFVKESWYSQNLLMDFEIRIKLSSILFQHEYDIRDIRRDICF